VSVGSTSPGFRNTIIADVLLVIVLLGGGLWLRGLGSVKKHGIETAAMGILGIVTVIVFVYGTQFTWEIVHADYDDHAGLVEARQKSDSVNQQQASQSTKNSQGAIARLTQDNKNLSADLQDRKYNMHPEDPVWQHTIQLYDAFKGFSNAIAMNNAIDKAKCEILVSAPTDSGASSSLVSQLTFAAKLSLSSCRLGPLGDQADPDVEKQAEDGTRPGLLVIHTTWDDSKTMWSSYIYDAFAGVHGGISVKRDYTMPTLKKQQPSQWGRRFPQPEFTPVMWLQFGKDVKWPQ
jgi:hypothetical protein